MAPNESESGGPETTASKVEEQILEFAGAGRGVHTSQAWTKALAYAVPMHVDGARGLVKMVLLLRNPGGLSDHGVGVNFKTKPCHA